MAVTQYIGARYVPFFYVNPDDGSNDWHASVQYDPLTIVTYLNQSYTSKIPVPATVGNPADNPTYWVLTGGYNAQVAQIASDLDDLEGDVQKIPTKRRFIIIGDSYGYGIQGGLPWVDGWLKYCHDTFDTDVYWLDQSVDPLSGNIGFASTLPFLTVLQEIENRTPIQEPETITDIVVIGGNNDTAGEAAIVAAIGAFVTYARGNYPNANISIGVLGYNAKNLYNTNEMYQKYRAGANAYGCSFISDLLLLAIDPTYYSDGTHVSAAGYSFINPYIAEAVLSGHCSYAQSVSIPLTMNTAVVNVVGAINYALKVDWNEKGYTMSIVDSYRESVWPPYVTSPTTSGTLLLSGAFSIDSGSHDILLPSGTIPMADVTRYGVNSAGAIAIVARGKMIKNNGNIDINGGFYNNDLVTGFTPAKQYVNWDYPGVFVPIV